MNDKLRKSISIKKTFRVTDNYDREFIFKGLRNQIQEIQNLCMATDFRENLIEFEDELGIFSIPVMQGTFTPNEDGDYVRAEQRDEWMKEYMPGFRLEFIDDNEIPYFSTCDGLELWYKEHYEWHERVLQIHREIQDLNVQMMSASKKVIRECEKKLAQEYKKLEDIDFDSFEVVQFLSKPIRRYRAITSKSDMELALEEVYQRH